MDGQRGIWHDFSDCTAVSMIRFLILPLLFFKILYFPFFLNFVSFEGVQEQRVHAKGQEMKRIMILNVKDT